MIFQIFNQKKELSFIIIILTIINYNPLIKDIMTQ